MSVLTDWISYELYPALYEVIDRALPEHSFNKYSWGWGSQTYLNGFPHKSRKDKTKVKQNSPYYIFEEGGNGKALIDYVMERDGADFMGAVKKLAGITGLQVPQDPSWDEGASSKYRERSTILEVSNDYFVFCLAKSTGAEEVRAYLTGRGYGVEDIEKMELGYVPSWDKLLKYLTGKGYDKNTVEEILGRDSRIGREYKLTIPYRTGGTIKGIKFRTIDQAVNPKYLNSPGLDKKGGFFNLTGLRGDKDLVIVEGELDALHSTAKGIDNVVALGGSDLHREQVENAKIRGARSLVLCFDREPGAEDKVLKALEILRDEEELRVYVATLPDLGDGKTDPDRLLKERGAEELRKVIAEATRDYEHKLSLAWEKHKERQGDKEAPTSLEFDKLIEDLTVLAYSIKRPVDRNILLTQVEDQLGTLGITRGAMEDTLEILRYKKDKENQARGLNKLLIHVKQLQEKGETDKALNELLERGRALSGMDTQKDYERLLQIPGEAEIKTTIQGEADSIETGYTLYDQSGSREELTLPSGALTIIAGRTSHRKTGLMLNMALNTASKYPGKEIHFFSYEESQEALLIKLMNIYINREFRPGTKNLRYIKGYYKSGGTNYTNTDFLGGRERFYNELISTGRIRVHYAPLDVDGLNGAIKYIASKGPVGAVFIDYIQLLRIRGEYQSRQLQLQEICERLRETAIGSRLPLILGAQFNREVQMEGQLDPGKIREAGDIEQTANLVLGLWDRAFTKENQGQGKEHRDRRGEPARYEPGTLYVEVLKGRDIGVGSSGELSYNGNTGKIINRDHFIAEL